MYKTEFFFCLGCTAMFLEPELFSVLTPPLETRPGTMAHERGRAAQEGRSRFAHARARREGGGNPQPSKEEIAAILRDCF
jgi:hypothetical protein